MSRRRKMAWWAAGTAAAVFVLALGTVLALRSQWFHGKVRARIVDTVERATGGRVEIASFRFDWSRMRAEVRGFTLHGTEPAGKPPLFRAASIAVGLKVVSILKRDVDIESLEVAGPRIYLIVAPDGRTNLPEPAVKNRERAAAVETILKLAIGRFRLSDGLFEVESRGRAAFDAQGRALLASFFFDPGAARYRGSISVRPFDLQWPNHAPLPLDVALQLAFARNRIEVTDAGLESGASSLRFSGSVEDFRSPRASFQYRSSLSLADAARILRVKSPDRGTVQAQGTAVWRGASDYSVTGTVRAAVPEYRDSAVTLRDLRADGALSAGPKGIELAGVRYSLDYSKARRRVPLSGRIETVALRGSDLDLGGIALAALDGAFRGEAHVRGWDRYTAAGEIAGFDTRRAVALYSPEPLPWDGRASGTVKLSGSFRRTRELRAAASLAIAPEPGSVPVHGRIDAAYDAAGRVLDLGRSSLALPSSRVEFSGAIGREMRVHLETRDLDDLLPALGAGTAGIPVKLAGGRAVFDGTVTGSLDSPQIAGRLSTTGFAYQGNVFDSLRGDVSASPGNVRLQNATLASGSLRAQFDFAVGLAAWKTSPGSPIFGHFAIRNADIPGLAALAGSADLPATGTVGANGRIAGTIGTPLVDGAVEIADGTLDGEPFDRFTAQVKWNGRTIDVASGHWTAGAKQVDLSAAFDHQPGNFRSGRLRFQLAGNAMPLDAIRTLRKSRPGVKGTVQVSAAGTLYFSGGPDRPLAFRIEELHGDLFGNRLQLTGQALGNLRLTADTRAGVLYARLESDFAGSSISGGGQWSLEGDYPGAATITFSKVDFAELRDWIAPANPAAARFAGSAAGELRIDGPALKPQALKAELKLTSVEIGPAPSPGSAAPSVFALHNAGPVTATMANRVVTVGSARLQGRATDVTLTGKVSLDLANPLDLRVAGRVDPAVLHDFDSGISASGSVTAEAAVRGTLASPQVNGRLAFQNVELDVADFPNGISNANGVITFTGDRATIQSFTGDTGGGKVVLAGNAGYGNGRLIFRLHVRAEQVRVRYPEGVSTVANASLNLTGTSANSMLSGTVTVLRTGFNPQSDFSSVLAKSAEPVRTPAARTGLLGGLNFDVQIATAPDIQVESALTQDVQVDANLKLRGTVSNPALLGRINITQGQLLFFGTKYNISQGSISFFNPVKLDPIFDVDLETKARGIDVTLTVSGPLKNLKLTPRSDPPLQFNEIISLLATGRTPTSDPTLLAQQATTPQAWQQTGASAILGSAIASPVAGRLQRFFGVSKLRIDPTLPGVEYNPQARITLEQQVTPEITFTYITNVTSSNPQVVSLEWDFSKQWSVVALREENGLFGVDFFFKRRFK